MARRIITRRREHSDGLAARLRRAFGGERFGAPRATRLAAVAALAASAGDSLMLYVLNAQRPELGLPPAPSGTLAVGAVLGVLGIPLYALGYGAAARELAGVLRRGAPILLACGLGAAGIGAIIHGLTALHIRRDLVTGASPRPPFEASADWGAGLALLWAIAAGWVLVASVLYAIGVRRQRTTQSVPGAALANPALVTGVLGAAALPFELGRSFLAPAAPNLAHALCFLAWGWVLRGPEAPRVSSQRSVRASPDAAR